MITLRARRPVAMSPRMARAFPIGSAASNILGDYIAAFGRDFVGKRGTAYSREEGRAGRGGAQKTTDRGPDKRPQGAARSVGCFCLVFSLIRQRAASTRNVRRALNGLLVLRFPHIAGAGHG